MLVGNTPVFMWSVQNSNAHDEATGVIVCITLYLKDSNVRALTMVVREDPSPTAYNSTSQQDVLTWDVGYMPKDGWVTAYVTLMVMEVGDTIHLISPQPQIWCMWIKLI